MPPEPEPEEPESEDETEEPAWSGFHDCPPDDSEEKAEEPSSEALDVAQPSADLLPESFVQQLAQVPVLVAASDYTLNNLEDVIQVQEALVNICAARADAMAVLSMPQHFTRRQLVDWQQRLTGIPAFHDGRPLSYAVA
jgi:hypothetical protein